mmetsp:Transcript_7155/g.10617  ORF Transcript_7155/g.10617 Transcript_7155/m.10617 type:complete len:110 (-) Transcript_7155:1127-1456(-)
MESTAMAVPNTPNVDIRMKKLGAGIQLGIHGVGGGMIQGRGGIVERTVKNAITIGVVARGEIRDTTTSERGGDCTDITIGAAAEVEAEASVEAETGSDLEVRPADNVLD